MRIFRKIRGNLCFQQRDYFVVPSRNDAIQSQKKDDAPILNANRANSLYSGTRNIKQNCKIQNNLLHLNP